MGPQLSMNPAGRCTSDRTRSDAGFALTEVLVALVACALVLTAYLAAIGHSTRASRTSSDRLTAAAFAQSKFDALGTVDKLEVGTSEGAFDDRFHWTLRISEDDAALRRSSPLRPLHVALRVYWHNYGREERVDYASVKLLRVVGGHDAQ